MVPQIRGGKDRRSVISGDPVKIVNYRGGGIIPTPPLEL